MYLLYRIEKDNKFHQDDNTGRFGMQFDSFDKMRAATVPACELIKVTFVGSNNGRATDSRKQIYEIIRPGETQ